MTYPKYKEKYRPTIGLEFHIKLNCQHKLFSKSPNKYGCDPNSNISLIDVAIPGSLPILNRSALESAILLGTSLHCKISPICKFDRKHYFYPDLPKGYQISQFYSPIAKAGVLFFRSNQGIKFTKVEKIQIEEDAGKNIHTNNDTTFCDFNRAGSALLELVTSPNIHSPIDAGKIFEEVKLLVSNLGICNSNLEEGDIRVDANISISNNHTLGTKVEIKNLNSIKFLIHALKYEIHTQLLQASHGQKIKQETKLWDPFLKETITIRSKEKYHDYKFFPEPDLPSFFCLPLINEIKTKIKEIPIKKYYKYLVTYNLNSLDAHTISSSDSISKYFNCLLEQYTGPSKILTNFFINELQLDTCIPTDKSIQLLSLLNSKKISRSTMRNIVFLLKQEPNLDILKHIEYNNLFSDTNNSMQIKSIVEKTCLEFPQEVKKYKAGKIQVLNFLLGHIIKTEPNLCPSTLKQVLLSTLAK